MRTVFFFVVCLYWYRVAIGKKLRPIEAAVRCSADPRSPLPITIQVRDMLRQRG